MFWSTRYNKLTALNASIRTDNDKRILVAKRYRGAGERNPRSQVARIPPLLLIMKPKAMAVARLVCGAVLFAFHVESVGAAIYVPGTEKNNEAY